MNTILFNELITQPMFSQKISNLLGSDIIRILIKEKDAKDITAKYIYGDLLKLKTEMHETLIRKYEKKFKGKEIQGSYVLPDGKIEWYDLGTL